MRPSCNVLVSSAGRRVELLRSFRAALSSLDVDGKLLASDRSWLASAYHDADLGVVVPGCFEPSFIPAMLELCAAHSVGLVVPTIDTELHVLADHRDEFAEIGTTVAVSGPRTIALAEDKVATNQWFVDHAIPTVPMAGAMDVLDGIRPWEFPGISKPRRGSASVGVALVRDRLELLGLPGLADRIIQAVAPGQEHTIDVLVGRDGEPRCVVPRRRLEVRAGEVSKAVTVRHGPLIALVTRLVRELPDAFGVLNVQCFVSGDELNAIEVNARFGGGFPLALHAGADFPRWLLEEHLGLPSTATFDQWTDDLVMLRYDAAVFVHASPGVLEPSS
jgi:carbamoyl-phosphate synthase large subunit